MAEPEHHVHVQGGGARGGGPKFQRAVAAASVWLNSAAGWLGAISIALIIAYAIMLARRIGVDADARTFFIEEFHTGEAGRAHYLFRRWFGEGETWQSYDMAPGASLLSGASFALFGFGLVQLRLPYLLFSIASLVFFALALRLNLPKARWLAFAGLVIFMLSPVLTSLRSTSTNELSYLAIGSTCLFLFAAVSRLSVPNARHVLYGLIGFVSGLAVFVKPDGAAIPLAALVVIAIERFVFRRKEAGLGGLIAGGAVAAFAYIVAMLSMVGMENIVKGFQAAQTSFETARLRQRTFIGKSINVLFRMPKNIDVFFPGVVFFLVFALAAGLRFYNRLTLAEKFALVVIIVNLVLSFFMPLVYWKRAVLPSAFALFLVVSVTARLLEISPRPVLRRPSMAAAALVSVVIGSICAASGFRGMWHVEFPWRDASLWGETVLYSGLGVAVLGAAFFLRASGSAARIAQAGILAMATATAASGVHHMIVRGESRQAAEIGRDLAAEIGEGSVVSDHNGFRFSGYFSRAPFAFIHENDRRFPSGIAALIEERAPDNVLVTNAYADLRSLVERRAPGYRLVKTYSYTHPIVNFGEAQVIHDIYLFQRDESGPEEGAL